LPACSGTFALPLSATYFAGVSRATPLPLAVIIHYKKKKYAKNYSPFRKVHRCLALRLYRLRQKKINTQKIMQILHNFVVFGVAPPTACGNYVSKKNKYAKNYPNFDEILGSFAKTTKTLLARKNNTEPCEK
jgi:hypothetical protein